MFTLVAVNLAACGEAGPTEVAGSTTWDVDIDVTYMDLRYCSQGTRPIVYQFTVVAGGNTLGYVRTLGFPAESGSWTPNSYLHHTFDPLSAVVTIPDGEEVGLDVVFEAGEWGSGLLNPQLVGKRTSARFTVGSGIQTRALDIGTRSFGPCSGIFTRVVLRSKART